MGKGVPASGLPEPGLAFDKALQAQVAVAAATGIRLDALVESRRGDARTAFARQTAMYLCRLVFAMSFGDIAAAFARDRSTARHAVQRIEEAREDPDIDRRLSWLEHSLEQAGGVHG